MFSQSRVEVSASLTNVGSLAAGAFDLVNCSLSVVWGGNKKICRDQGRLTFLSRGLAARFRARGYTARACAPT